MKFPSLKLIFLPALLLVVALLPACGGGGGGTPSASTPSTDVAAASNSAYPAAYLKKYQGTWMTQCPSPVKFADGSYGEASARERLEFSAPDEKGQMSLALTIELFNTRLTCYDYTTKPFASVKWAKPISISMDRVVTINIFGPTATDVVKSAREATSSVVVGTDFSSVMSSGVDSWRIDFADGKSLVQAKFEPAISGEVSLFSFGLNLEPNALLALNGATHLPYRRQ